MVTEQQSQSHQQDVHIRDDGRYEERPLQGLLVVRENDGHGALQHRECHRAEKEHDDEAHNPHEMPAEEESPHLVGEAVRIPGGSADSQVPAMVWMS